MKINDVYKAKEDMFLYQNASSSQFLLVWNVIKREWKLRLDLEDRIKLSEKVCWVDRQSKTSIDRKDLQEGLADTGDMVHHSTL